MTVDEKLWDTFSAHEYLAPDAALVLREVQRRTAPGRPPRRRLAVIGAVVGAAAVVAAIAASVAVMAGGSVHGIQQPAAPVTVTATATATVTPSVSIVPSASISAVLPSIPVPAGLPTGRGSELPVAPWLIRIDHTGPYSYTSAPLPLDHYPNSMGVDSSVVGGTALMSGPMIEFTDGARKGEIVIKVSFTVQSFTGTPSLEISPPEVEGTAGATNN